MSGGGSANVPTATLVSRPRSARRAWMKNPPIEMFLLTVIFTLTETEKSYEINALFRYSVTKYTHFKVIC